jgi:hypothetical protein
VTDLWVAALTVTMAAPIAWGHHYGIALPMFAAVLPEVAAAPSRAGLVLLGLAYVLVSNELRPLTELITTGGRVLQSYLFLGAGLFLALLYRLRFRQQQLDTAPVARVAGAIGLGGLGLVLASSW